MMILIDCWMCRKTINECIDKEKIKQLIIKLKSENILLKNEINQEILNCPICYNDILLDNIFFTDCAHYSCKKCYIIILNNYYKKKKKLISIPVNDIPYIPYRTNRVINNFNFQYDIGDI